MQDFRSITQDTQHTKHTGAILGRGLVVHARTHAGPSGRGGHTGSDKDDHCVRGHAVGEMIGWLC